MDDSEEAQLQRALALSLQTEEATSAQVFKYLAAY